jgi:hypothetical protein
MSKKLDVLGRKFGRLLVISRAGNSKSGDCTWNCQCDCGGLNSLVVSTASNLTTRKHVSCGCYKRENAQRLYYKGTKDISGCYFSKLKWGALQRGLDFAITILYIQELLEIIQGYKCALSQIPIKGSISNRKELTTYSEMTASLDRIDSSKGYIVGNVQWVHKDINNMKQAFPQDYFIEICKLIAKNN